MDISKYIKSAALAVALAVFAAPPASEAAKGNDTRSLDREIQICVAEIGKRADYGGARRVVHRITDVEQRNIAEQTFRINTRVFASENDAAIREYSSHCVTRGSLKLVNLKIDQENAS